MQFLQGGIRTTRTPIPALMYVYTAIDFQLAAQLCTMTVLCLGENSVGLVLGAVHSCKELLSNILMRRKAGQTEGTSKVTFSCVTR
jgi:hypothetical protein